MGLGLGKNLQLLVATQQFWILFVIFFYEMLILFDTLIYGF